jgi:hypothetical protein
MGGFIKSILSFSWATSLFSARQLLGALSGRWEEPVGAFQKVARAAAANLEGSLAALHTTGERVQNGIVDAVIPSPAPPPPTPGPKPLKPADSGRLPLGNFVVLGEGLAAGMGDFSLASSAQTDSFPSQMARQMGVPFVQPLIEPPGIGDAFGFAPLPVIVPSPLQTTVVNQIPPSPPQNLSVPGLTILESIHSRPRQPLVDRNSSKQTAINLILGVRGIAYGAPGPLATQLETAVAQKPTFALVALGYTEAIEATVAGDPARLPTLDSLRNTYPRIVESLRSTGAEVLVLTFPDPLDTAYFSTLSQAAETAKVDPDLLAERWQLKPDDLITANGLNEIGFQIFGARLGPLPSGSVLPASTAAEMQRRIGELNLEIAKIAAAKGAHAYDLFAFLKKLRAQAVSIGTRKLTANYLGGIYCINGYYPGATGHALIANDILSQLNRDFGAKFPLIDIPAVMATDPVAAYKPAPGPNWTRQNLPASAPARPNVSTEPAFLPPPQTRPNRPLTLPPGLEQVLPLNPALSYFGDGIAPLNERSPQTIQYGSGGNLIFGGLAMVDSHLHGNIRIKFSPPVNGCSKFQISFEGLTGEDEVLAAPRFFKMAFRQNSVSDIPGFVSSGTLNLNTGEVDVTKGALNIFALYSSTALNALVSVNPSFPLPPAAPLSFPGQYGTACVIFEQRPDGKLDFTFYGATFVPLGKGIVWPLNFTGPSMQFATIPAAGTVMHPHLALSTKEAPPPTDSITTPDIPFNTIREYTLFAPISSFGDVFTLNAPQFGGPATGRSRLLGRVQIQFGPRCGNSVPVAVSTTTAGATLAPMDPTPLAQLFPARLTPGPLGFYENLRFPLRTYSLNDLAIIDDPFDIAVGLLDLSSGRLRHPLLHRGFINQDLIFALLRVEPCTPQNSFLFRGAAEFTKDPNGQSKYQFYGQVHIPYPAGFLFPEPNLATGVPIRGDSALDPYLWFWALQDDVNSDVHRTGGGELISSKGESFSYRYSISASPDRHPIEFEYENFTQQGKFRMHSLAWVGFGNSNTGSSSGECDTISFTGFGVWTKAGLQQVELASVQISTSPTASYVGIQIGSGDVSNVNTAMPPTAFPVRPPEPGGFLCAIGLPSTPPPQAPSPRPCPEPPPCGAAMM